MKDRELDQNFDWDMDLDPESISIDDLDLDYYLKDADLSEFDDLPADETEQPQEEEDIPVDDDDDTDFDLDDLDLTFEDEAEDEELEEDAEEAPAAAEPPRRTSRRRRDDDEDDDDLDEDDLDDEDDDLDDDEIDDEEEAEKPQREKKPRGENPLLTLFAPKPKTRRERPEALRRRDAEKAAEAGMQPVEAGEPSAVPVPQNKPAAQPQKPVNPVRQFKEAYLPLLIAGIAGVMILIFVIGSVSRAIEQGKANKEASIDASISASQEADRITDELENVIRSAKALAAGYNYLDAIDMIDSFSGSITDYPELSAMRGEYINADNQLIAWTDPSAIPNLTFQVLIADPARAFSAQQYGGQYNRNFVTIDEFSAILQQLYDNGYVLVNLDSFTEKEVAEDGDVTFIKETIRLPEGKKPIMITETQVNYYRYMVDSDEDGIADAGGSGFASKLVVENGKVINEMVTASGETVRGAYDLVPILDAFIESHPDFSYHGAKAIIAITGYDGVFGYRTNNTTLADHASQAADAAEVAKALQDSGYQLACYTYANVPYGKKSATDIQEDLRKWTNEVVPIIGQVDILVYALNSELDNTAYSTSKFDVMYDAGFHYFLGFGSTPWAEVNNDYVRQSRIVVSGTNMAHYPANYSKYFDSTTILNAQRGDVPRG